MLKFCKNNVIQFDGEIVDPSINLKEFLFSNLDTSLDIESNLTTEELIHHLYPLKNFIFEFFSEEYELIRAYFMAGTLRSEYSKITFFQECSIEEGTFHILGRSKLVHGAHQTSKLSEIVVDIDYNLAGDVIKGSKKVMTLLGLMRILFGGLSEDIKNYIC